MHELAITQQIVETCCEAAGEAPVARVTVEIGSLCGVLPDALRFCFDVCAQGTSLEGATLEIVTIAAQARCRDCGAQLPAIDWLALCDCGSANLERHGGDALRIMTLELA